MSSKKQKKGSYISELRSEGRINESFLNTVSELKLEELIAIKIEQSSQMMKSMQALVSIPDVRKAAMDMAREMEKAGLIEEMQEDMMEMMDPEDMDDEIAEEVDKVVTELTGNILDDSDVVPQGKIQAQQQEEQESSEVREMEARLQKLTS